MTAAISDFVLPVSLEKNEASFVGTAFVVSDFLITAGHVLGDYRDYYARYCGNYLTLSPDKWIPQLAPAADKLEYDVALYRAHAPQSPLVLAPDGDDVAPDDELELVCWQRTGGKLRQVSTRCLTLGDAQVDGYFKIATVGRITHGSSGCPVMKDGKVYGIVTMGRDYFELSDDMRSMSPRARQVMQVMGRNTCWVFKTSHIRRFIPRE